MNPKKPELMCPVRDFATLDACKDYADAVYFGISDFSMRASANILKLPELQKFIAKCHRHKIKAYPAVNCILYNNDLIKVEKIFKKIKQAGADAVIVWDPAAIILAKKYKIPFIISTQANISNYQAAKFYKNLGAKRVVLAREMTLKQIKELKKKIPKVEIEVFVHGAMCVSVSGRCLLSAFLYGKSANRGSCGQPCRKKWKIVDEEKNKLEIFEDEFTYLTNPKDLCLIEYIPELIKAGIDSFKIEGRRRDPNYVQTTAKYYRQAIDAYFASAFSRQKAGVWKKELAKIYNRGFSTGFYFGKPGSDGISYDQSDNISLTKKILAGQVTKFFPKIKTASILLNHRGLKVNDQIIIEGKNTFIKQNVASMQKENINIKSAIKGEEIAIKVLAKVKANDRVYILKN